MLKQSAAEAGTPPQQLQANMDSLGCRVGGRAGGGEGVADE